MSVSLLSEEMQVCRNISPQKISERLSVIVDALHFHSFLEPASSQLPLSMLQGPPGRAGLPGADGVPGPPGTSVMLPVSHL